MNFTNPKDFPHYSVISFHLEHHLLLDCNQWSMATCDGKIQVISVSETFSEVSLHHWYVLSQTHGCHRMWAVT